MFRKLILAIAVGLLVLGLSAALPGRAVAQDHTVCTRSHTVVRGNTLHRLGRTYGLGIDEIQRINNMGSRTRIYVGESLCVQAYTISDPVSETRYVVRRGDTLSRIARRHGVSMTVLARVNNLANPNHIYVGQVLTIPDVTIQVQ